MRSGPFPRTACLLKSAAGQYNQLMACLPEKGFLRQTDEQLCALCNCKQGEAYDMYAE